MVTNFCQKLFYRWNGVTGRKPKIALKIGSNYTEQGTLSEILFRVSNMNRVEMIALLSNLLAMHRHACFNSQSRVAL